LLTLTATRRYLVNFAHTDPAAGNIDRTGRLVVASLRACRADHAADRRGQRVDVLGGQFRARSVEVTGDDVAVDALSERGDVSDAGDPMIQIAAYCLAGEPDLDGAAGERGEGERPVRVPLDADRAGPQARGPLLLAVVGVGLVVAEGGVRERPLEAVPGDLDGQDALLAWLGGPPGPVHHPQE
jgi:hypothetical protein